MVIIDKLVRKWLPSLRARVLWTAFIVVLLFVAITAVVLKKAFEHSLISRLEIQLEVQTLALLSVADELTAGKLFMPEALQDERLNQLSSGRYARVINDKGEQIWISTSAIGLEWKLTPSLLSGESVFYKSNVGGESVYSRDFGITWESSSISSKELSESFYTFQVAESRKGINVAIRDFREQLYTWLGLLGVTLLLVQFLFLRFGLGPLRRISSELKQVEKGELEELKDNYPEELKGLASRINELLHFEMNQRRRYRDSLGDLAHSLKTPLSILSATLDKLPQDSNVDDFQLELSRINKTISYYLNRAMVVGVGSVITPVLVEPVIQQLFQALQKVYRDKDVSCEMNLDLDSQFFGNEGDLMELLGNLMDNAYKYCNQKVKIQLKSVSNGFELSIENDGLDIDELSRDKVLKRGARLDEKGIVKGQGIGLSVVTDIVRAYEAELKIESSELGGACFKLKFESA